MDFEHLKRIDGLKTKILKYISFKKRTEQEVRQKFKNEDTELLGETIEDLKELGYINDKEYIERFVKEVTILKNLSIYEIKYKLMTKGINRDIIDEYFDINDEMLKEYEKQSAGKIIEKKMKTMEKEDIKNYLLRKNFLYTSIEELNDI